MLYRFILILLSYVTLHLHASIHENTLIKLDSTLIPLRLLAKEHSIICHNVSSNTLSTSHLIHISKKSTRTIYHIQLPTSTIICSPEQLLYDPLLKQWVSAKNISSNNIFLNSNGSYIPCIHVEKQELDKPMYLYDLTLTKPHTFFISKEEVLAHNFLPIVIGLSWAFGEGIALSGIGIGIGTLGLGLWQTFGKHKKITFAQIQEECMNSSYSNFPNPDNNNNNKDFFETLKKRTDKVGRSIRFGKIYRDPNTKLWWSKDNARHGGSYYKVFKEGARGFEWLYDADILGKEIVGKHKGSNGLFIPFKEVAF